MLQHTKARRMNIKTDLDIRVRPDLDISAADLSVIIGNTVDNAIEACRVLEEDQEDIDPAHQKAVLLYYKISNPYRKRDSGLSGRKRMQAPRLRP